MKSPFLRKLLVGCNSFSFLVLIIGRANYSKNKMALDARQSTGQYDMLLNKTKDTLYKSLTQWLIRVKTEKKFTGAKIGAIFCKITSRITTKKLKIGP